MRTIWIIGILVPIFSLSIASQLFSQKLKLEWNGSEEDLIQLIEGGKIRFSIQGHSSGVPDRITFRIKSEPADTLVDVMTLVEEGFLRLLKEPENDMDAATKSYVDAEISWLKSMLGVGEITDLEGNVYPTIQIGTQTWMAKNLNIGSMIAGSMNQTDNGIIEKYCYNDDEINCEIYGGLYQWLELMDYVTTEGSQGFCPIGWHIPSEADWQTLATHIGGVENAGGKLKEVETIHWASPNVGATNESRFTSLPGGYRTVGGEFVSLNTDGNIWSSTENLANQPKRLTLYNSSAYFFFGDMFSDRDLGFYARCIKD